LFPHGVDTYGSGFIHRLVNIQCTAVTILRTKTIKTVATCTANEFFGGRSLGDDVHVTTCSTTTIVSGSPFIDFHLLNVKGIAHVVTRITEAINIDAAAGIKTAHTEVGG